MPWISLKKSNKQLHSHYPPVKLTMYVEKTPHHECRSLGFPFAPSHFFPLTQRGVAWAMFWLKTFFRERIQHKEQLEKYGNIMETCKICVDVKCLWKSWNLMEEMLVSETRIQRRRDPQRCPNITCAMHKSGHTFDSATPPSGQNPWPIFSKKKQYLFYIPLNNRPENQGLPKQSTQRSHCVLYGSMFHVTTITSP